MCWQLPLRREDTTDDRGHTTATIRQWDRTHWGEGGDEFHWWCTEDSEAFVGTTRVVDSLADELIEMTSPDAYAQVRRYCTARGRAVAHPATLSDDHQGGGV